jgi:hypothetical protein
MPYQRPSCHTFHVENKTRESWELSNTDIISLSPFPPEFSLSQTTKVSSITVYALQNFYLSEGILLYSG